MSSYRKVLNTTAAARKAKEQEQGIEPSVFRMRPLNQLGIQFEKSKQQALQVALTSPSHYFNLRTTMIEGITETLTEIAYSVVWDILSMGLLPDGAQMTLGDKIYSPNLPDSVINDFALKISAHLKQESDDLIELCLPIDFNDLAVRQSKAGLKLRGFNV